jgi:Ras-related protein Rab-1A
MAQSQAQVDYLYKILLLGSSAVGKSSLLLRFADDTFKENQVSTIGVDWKIRTVDVNGKLIKLQLWDSAGQERFRTIASSYYRGAHGVAVVFDLTDAKTFAAVESWLEEIGEHANESVRRILIGNKNDLKDDRVVDEEEARAFAKSAGMQYIETSAKSSANVTEAFMNMTRDIFASIGTAAVAPRSPPGVVLSVPDGKSVEKKKGCC